MIFREGFRKQRKALLLPVNMEGEVEAPTGRVRASEPWIEKYRPARLDDIIAHKEIVSTIQRLIDSNQMPHLLLYGPPGTGKTSTILAIAKKLFGSNYRRAASPGFVLPPAVGPSPIPQAASA